MFLHDVMLYAGAENEKV